MDCTAAFHRVVVLLAFRDSKSSLCTGRRSALGLFCWKTPFLPM